MTCNCCLGIQLLDHKCREKGLETNCPICCEFMFTSSETVRDLPCGHYIHSACFQVYHLTPILDSSVSICSYVQGSLYMRIQSDNLSVAFAFLQAYAHTNYICPICSKSMGDMSVWIQFSYLTYNIIYAIILVLFYVKSFFICPN